VIAALVFTAGSTLWLGIAPGPVLKAAETAAHTLQVPTPDTSPSDITPSQPQHP
jgi:NADH-quinone oxidoreductase subunit N